MPTRYQTYQSSFSYEPTALMLSTRKKGAKLHTIISFHEDYDQSNHSDDAYDDGNSDYNDNSILSTYVANYDPRRYIVDHARGHITHDHLIERPCGDSRFYDRQLYLTGSDRSDVQAYTTPRHKKANKHDLPRDMGHKLEYGPEKSTHKDHASYSGLDTDGTTVIRQSDKTITRAHARGSLFSKDQRTYDRQFRHREKQPLPVYQGHYELNRTSMPQDPTDGPSSSNPEPSGPSVLVPSDKSRTERIVRVRCDDFRSYSREPSIDFLATHVQRVIRDFNQTCARMGVWIINRVDEANGDPYKKERKVFYDWKLIAERKKGTEYCWAGVWGGYPEKYIKRDTSRETALAFSKLCRCPDDAMLQLWEQVKLLYPEHRRS